MVIRQDWHKRVYRKGPKKMKREQQERWRELRAACLEREKYRCYRCEKKIPDNGRGSSTHHIIPRDEGGLDDMNNLITLCHKCHDFVEVEGFRTLADIAGSYDGSIEEAPEKPVAMREESFPRPVWHGYVYGGQKRPRP